MTWVNKILIGVALGTVLAATSVMADQLDDEFYRRVACGGNKQAKADIEKSVNADEYSIIRWHDTGAVHSGKSTVLCSVTLDLSNGYKIDAHYTVTRPSETPAKGQLTAAQEAMVREANYPLLLLGVDVFNGAVDIRPPDRVAGYNTDKEGIRTFPHTDHTSRAYQSGPILCARNQSSRCALQSNTVMSLATSSTNTNRTTPRLTFATAMPNAPPNEAFD